MKMSDVEFILRAEACRIGQLNFGESHIRSVADLALGSTVQHVTTNGDIVFDGIAEVAFVNRTTAVDDPGAESIGLRYMPGVGPSGDLIESDIQHYRPCDLGLAPYPDAASRWLGDRPVPWSPTVLLRHENPDSIA
jgi:hypothetical protein